MVYELMDHATGEWNEEVLTTKMASVDREAIMRISVGRLEEDTWAWQLERHGNFTVRSAYRALLQANLTIEPIGTWGSERPFWKKLWKMRIPPKVRNYWWRVIKGFIPCRSVLEARHIEKIKFWENSRKRPTSGKGSDFLRARHVGERGAEFAGGLPPRATRVVFW
jgi:hypothetical protein